MKNVLSTVLLIAGLTGTAQAAETQRYLIELRSGAFAIDRSERLTPLQQEAEIRESSVHFRSEQLGVVVADLTAAEAQELRRSRAVRWIEPDHEIRSFGTTPATPFAPSSSAAQTTPYGIGLVRADRAWQRTRGEGVKVAVADTGIDYRHPDIAPAYKGGTDLVDKDKDPMDENGHGTHVAGTIAAADNDIGVVGVAPAVELYAIRVLGKNGSGSSSLLVQALDWAVTNGIHIVNFSLGSDTYSSVLDNAFARAAEKGVISIAASGNDYDPSAPVLKVSYPAAYGSVISVGAIDHKSKVASFSQRGAELKVVAPGVAVSSSVPLGSSAASLVEIGSSSYNAHAMTGSPKPSALSGEFVFAGLGTSAQDFAGVRGKIALIERGVVTFAEKSSRAKQAGAIGVIVFNSAGNDGMVLGTLEGSTDYPGPFLPSLGISREDGLVLKAAANQSLSMKFAVRDYEALNGTSMATPHVAGVAALVKSLHPTADTAQIRNILSMTAVDLGDKGWDTTHGFGLIDADAATTATPVPSRRRGGRR